MDLKKQPRHKEGVKQESRQVHRHPFALLSISVWQLDDRIECFALTPANSHTCTSHALLLCEVQV